MMVSGEIAVFMEKQGLSLSELARKLGISRARLRKMRDNQAVIPPWMGLACAAIAWGLPGWRNGVEPPKAPEASVDGGTLIIGG